MEAFRSRWRLQRTPARSALLPARQEADPGLLVDGESELEPGEMQKKDKCVHEAGMGKY